jgi:hypothetical protein
MLNELMNHFSSLQPQRKAKSPYGVLVTLDGGLQLFSFLLALVVLQSLRYRVFLKLPLSFIQGFLLYVPLLFTHVT